MLDTYLNKQVTPPGTVKSLSRIHPVSLDDDTAGEEAAPLLILTVILSDSDVPWTLTLCQVVTGTRAVQCPSHSIRRSTRELSS